MKRVEFISRWFVFCFLLFNSGYSSLFAQVSDSIPPDKVKIKSGWNLGALPTLAYDSDLGLMYGAVLNLYDYGDGRSYPKYKQAYLIDVSQTTKGATSIVCNYDSRFLIPKVRFSGELSYTKEHALNFYGFNGNEVVYNSNFTNESNSAYISRLFYAMDRDLGRARADFYGHTSLKNFSWLAGLEYAWYRVASVDVDHLNRGKQGQTALPDTAILYDKYVEWGLISKKETEGGQIPLFKVGLIYDTRDNEPNPMKGIWSEVQLLGATSLLGSDYSYSRLVLTHRQYFTLVPKKLSFAVRASYQTLLTGKMPFYALPFVYNTAPNFTRNGLGGNKTIRGVLRNRVVGNGFLYGNNEIRYKFLRTILFNQNFYVALSSFLDWGLVVNDYKVDTSNVPESELALHFTHSKEQLHLSYGAGLHFAMNENFIIAVDYGEALSHNDGDSGLYITLNFLY